MESPDLVANLLNFNIVISEFEFQSYSYVHFGTNTLAKGVNTLILPVMRYIVPLLTSYKVCLSMK